MAPQAFKDKIAGVLWPLTEQNYLLLINEIIGSSQNALSFGCCTFFFYPIILKVNMSKIISLLDLVPLPVLYVPLCIVCVTYAHKSCARWRPLLIAVLNLQVLLDWHFLFKLVILFEIRERSQIFIIGIVQSCTVTVKLTVLIPQAVLSPEKGLWESRPCSCTDYLLISKFHNKQLKHHFHYSQLFQRAAWKKKKHDRRHNVRRYKVKLESCQTVKLFGYHGHAW